MRDDVDVADVKTLITGCATRAWATGDTAARGRMVDIVTRGLRADGPAEASPTGEGPPTR